MKSEERQITRHPGRLLAVFAHPDDETYLAGGTLARCAASGCEVFVLCATFGEAGRRGEYARLSRRRFAAVRRRELKAACADLGVHPPLFLGCADQGLARDCWQSATDEVTRTIRRLRPDVVVTFGPDGVSGHPDHVALSQIVTAAFRGAGLPALAPQGDEIPFQPAALYYVLRSAAVPSCCSPRDGTAAPPAVTTTIAIDGFGERKLAAARCHRSQRHLQPLTREQTTTILTAPEVFHRAVPAWKGGPPEAHFLGIPLPPAEPQARHPAPTVAKQQVIEAVREVVDPELRPNLVDLGMVREVRVEGGGVRRSGGGGGRDARGERRRLRRRRRNWFRSEGWLMDTPLPPQPHGRAQHERRRAAAAREDELVLAVAVTWVAPVLTGWSSP